jgi:hypothetical protein
MSMELNKVNMSLDDIINSQRNNKKEFKVVRNQGRRNFRHKINFGEGRRRLNNTRRNNFRGDKIQIISDYIKFKKGKTFICLMREYQIEEIIN